MFAILFDKVQVLIGFHFLVIVIFKPVFHAVSVMFSGFGQLGGKLGQPKQSLAKFQMKLVVRNDAKYRVAGLIELQAIKADRQVVLSELLVAFVVATGAAHDLVHACRCVAPLLFVE